MQDFGEVQRVTIGALGDLLAATETVGDDERFRSSGADRGEQLEFADVLRNCVFLFFKTKRTGHAATARCRRVEVEAKAGE